MLTKPITGELTEQLRMRPSKEIKRPRNFVFDFRVFVSSPDFFSNIKPFEVRDSTVYFEANGQDTTFEHLGIKLQLPNTSSGM
jgi:hypothetical protein